MYLKNPPLIARRAPGTYRAASGCTCIKEYCNPGGSDCTCTDWKCEDGRGMASFRRSGLQMGRQWPSRPFPLSGITDSLKSLLGGAFSVVQAGEQAKGAQAAMQAQQQMMLMQQQQGLFGMNTTTLLLLGGVGVGAYLLLRKKKPAPAAT